MVPCVLAGSLGCQVLAGKQLINNATVVRIATFKNGFKWFSEGSSMA